jgi:DNA-binding beta-propeller fold protein YncE
MKGRSLLLGGAVLLSASTAVLAQRAAPQAPQAPRFVVDPMWPKPMPNRWILGSTTGVAVDARDHVFVVHLTDSFTPRTEIGLATNPPTGECCAPAPNILEYDPIGALVGHWGGPGQGFDWPEMNAGLAIDDAGNVWIGGSGGADSRILKFSHDGKFIAEFGKAAAPVAASPSGRGADTAYAGVSPGRGTGRGAGGRGGRGRGGVPALPANSQSMDSFGGPTGFSFDAKANEAYVADGSRNHRVAVIDMITGAIKRSWGAYGNKPDDADTSKYDPAGPAPKQFGAPVSCAKLSNDGLVYVCDQRNDRIQVFKKDGSFVKEKGILPKTLGSGSVWDIAFSRDPQQKYLYVADGMNMQVHIIDRQTLDVLTSFGDGGRQPGQFYAVHSVATDSKGNLYTTETYEGKRVQKFTFNGIGTVLKANEGVLWPTRATGRSGTKGGTRP